VGIFSLRSPEPTCCGVGADLPCAFKFVFIRAGRSTRNALARFLFCDFSLEETILPVGWCVMRTAE
jgi:hypothetical protein